MINKQSFERTNEGAVLAAAPINGINIISLGNGKGKGEEGTETLKKMGRPKAEKPKEIKYSIRTDAETESRLTRYCERKGITKGEAYRKAINLLMELDKAK